MRFLAQVVRSNLLKFIINMTRFALEQEHRLGVMRGTAY